MFDPQNTNVSASAVLFGGICAVIALVSPVSGVRAGAQRSARTTSPSTTSSSRARARARAGAGKLAWKWSKALNLYPQLPLRGKVLHVHYVLRAKPAGRSRAGVTNPGSAQVKRTELRKELRKGGVSKVVWKTVLPGKDRGGAAMVVAHKRIYVARFHPSATGCNLFAYTTARGKLLWKTRLRGMGSVGHSKWYNRVQLGVVRGHPVVYGHEGPATSYIEMRDARSGALRVHRRFKMPRPARPLAELLYHEVHRVLNKRAVYRRTVKNFLRAHRRTFASRRKARSAVRWAVRQINGLPLYGTAHTLKIRLLRKNARAYVIVARR
jgi:hypothetical protein